ncbi:MAG TPA: efflux RND transporter permease subunit [Pirellulales bacterium]|nr:efflux RND transporter permease subunit [Pirellulales bacterium]
MNDASVHPTLERLLAFDRGMLAPEEWPEIDRHIAACESCCQKLDDLPEDYMVAVLRNPPTSTDGAPPSNAGHHDLTAQAHATDENEQPLAELPPELENHPRYRLLAPLGAGGMGTVYRAEHKLMGRVVALKVIQNRLLGKPDWIERFRREIRAAAHLNHPNIVHAYDAEQVGDAQLLVMEYVEGETLEHVVERHGPLPVTEACEYARQAALGLSHACERGMVHRDIKPQNLLRTPAGQVKILDFGLARFVSENVASSPLTHSGLTMGTPDYLAPEQALDPRRADVRADLYSLGCTVYFLLTGSPPYPEGTPLQKVLSHQDETPAPLAQRRPDVPAELRRSIEKMMAKDAADRYQTPDEVVAALAPWTASGASVEALPVERRPQRRAKVVLALSSCAMLGSLFAAAAYAWKRAADASVPPSRVVMVVTRVAGASAGVVEKAATDPIERAVCRASGISHLESHSIQGLSIVKIQFRDEVSQASAVATTNALVHHATPELPADSSPLVMPVDFDADSPLGFVAWERAHLDPGELADFAGRLRARFGSLPGIGPVTVEGRLERVTLVRCDRVRLQARNVSLLELARSLKAEAGPGLSSQATVGGAEYGIRSVGTRGKDLATIPLPNTPPGSRSMYVGDVATVEETVASGDPVVRVDGNASVIMPIYAMAGADGTGVLASVRKETGDEARLCTFAATADHGLLHLQLRLASGAALKKTETMIEEIEDAVRSQIPQDDIEFLLSRVGVGDDWPAAFSDNASSCDATIDVRLTEDAARDDDRYASSLRGMLEKDERFSHLEIVVTTEASSTLDLRIFAGSLDEGRKHAERVRQRLRGIARELQIQIVERLDAPAYEVKVDLRKAADLGITAEEVRAQLALATGAEGSSWSGADFGPRVRMEMNATFDRVVDLLNLPIGGERQNKLVRLGDIAQLETTVGPMEIDHVGSERVTLIRVYFDKHTREATVQSLRDVVAELTGSPGVRLELAE